LAKLEDDRARAALMEIKGLGAWSADVYLLMALRRPDVWPEGDLALAIAATNLKRRENRITPRELSEMAEAWRPYRSVAARMLWQSYLAEKKGSRRSPSVAN
jgi:DNA-3-methyladenine glycosylase II